MNVLCVDEDLATLKLVEVLGSWYPDDRFEITTTLADAKSKLWLVKYEVLLLDIMMPSDEEAVPGSSEEGGVVSGLMLLDMVRQDPECANQHIPVVLLTGVPPALHPRIQEEQEARKDQGTFFQKPVRVERVYKSLKDAMAGGRV